MVETCWSRCSECSSPSLPSENSGEWREQTEQAVATPVIQIYPVFGLRNKYSAQDTLQERVGSVNRVHCLALINRPVLDVELGWQHSRETTAEVTRVNVNILWFCLTLYISETIEIDAGCWCMEFRCYCVKRLPQLTDLEPAIKGHKEETILHTLQKKPG